MARTLQEKVLAYIECTGAALEKAEKEASSRATLEEKVADLIPGVVEKLLANGRIKPHQKEAAADLLRDPVKALEILAKTAEHRNDEEIARLGSQVETTKKASFNSLNTPYVGARTSEAKESDRVLFEKLGLRF